MYVCLCLGITDKEIKAMIDQGAQNVGDLQKACAAGTDCGSCIESMKKAFLDQS